MCTESLVYICMQAVSYYIVRDVLRELDMSLMVESIFLHSQKQVLNKDLQQAVEKS